MQVKSLQQTPIEEILETLNLAFSDYFVPIHFTIDYVNERWKASGVDYNLSFGVFDENRLVGFIIHAINNYQGEQVAYNASTGIIPTHRRKGLLTKLYAKAIPALRKNGIQKSTLEVITDNERAILAYKKIGFQIDRTFFLYKFDWKERQVATTSSVDLRASSDFCFSDFNSLENYVPSIENQEHCLHKYQNNLKAIYVYENGEIVAYLIFHTISKRIHRLGVKENKWITYGEILFSGLKSGQYNIINIDSENTAMHEFFKKMKFDNYINQYDMNYNLEP